MARTPLFRHLSRALALARVANATRRPAAMLCFSTSAKSGPGLATARRCATATFANSTQ